MQPLKRFLPLAAFLLLVVLLVRGLSLDPTELPSARLGDSLPDFNLPVLGSPSHAKLRIGVASQR